MHKGIPVYGPIEQDGRRGVVYRCTRVRERFNRPDVVAVVASSPGESGPMQEWQPEALYQEKIFTPHAKRTCLPC
jgi:hypothetical protein